MLLKTNEDPFALRAELERACNQLDPNQYLREYYINAVDAAATLFEVGFVIVRRGGRRVMKEAVADDGRGMNPADLVDLMSTVRKSTLPTHTLDGHYGWGARVAAAPRNRFGLVMISKAPGYQPALVRMWKQTGGVFDPDEGLYDLQEFAGRPCPTVDPETETTVPGFGAFRLADFIGRIGSEAILSKPSWTVVIFGGDTPEETTVRIGGQDTATYLDRKLVDTPLKARVVAPRSSDPAALQLPIVNVTGPQGATSRIVHPLRSFFARRENRLAGVVEVEPGVKVHWSADPNIDLEDPKGPPVN